MYSEPSDSRRDPILVEEEHRPRRWSVSKDIENS